MNDDLIDSLITVMPSAENIRTQRTADIRRYLAQVVQDDSVAAEFDNISAENNPSSPQYAMPYNFSGSLDQTWEVPTGVSTQNTRIQGDNMSSTEELDLIINKADLYHIDLGEESMLDALKAIKKMVQADNSVSDGEVIDYIDGFLVSIGV